MDKIKAARLEGYAQGLDAGRGLGPSWTQAVIRLLWVLLMTLLVSHLGYDNYRLRMELRELRGPSVVAGLPAEPEDACGTEAAPTAK